jgi:bacterioferritin-associated ferredoxin
MYVCLCKGLTEADVRRAGLCGPVSCDALASTLGIDQQGCCGRCLRNIHELVTLATSETSVNAG